MLSTLKASPAPSKASPKPSKGRVMGKANGPELGTPKYAGVSKLPTVGLPAVNRSVLAQIYARLRATMMQIWLPSLCVKCKPTFIKAAQRPTDKMFPMKAFCDGCREFLLSKQQASKPNAQTTEKPAASSPALTDAVSVIKNRVISEIESIIKPAIDISQVKYTQKAPSSYAPYIPRSSSPIEKDDLPRPPLNLPLQSDTPVYESLTIAGADWCRYCGTTAGTSWRPGPWGPRSLCFRHGRDYAVHKKLDLSSFEGVTEDRTFPVLQGFCKICWKDDGYVRKCHGCANGFHAPCYLKRTNKNVASLLAKPWYCNSTCPRHFENGTIRVTHSTKELLPFQPRQLIEDSACNDDNVSDTETMKSESLDVVTADPDFKPHFIIRLKEPIRPLTPIPDDLMVIKEKDKKRRVSCPVATTTSQPPQKKQRKSRASSQSIPDFLITVDHTIAIRREESPKPVICPSYRVISRPPFVGISSDQTEFITDELFSNRHHRYEEMEKHTRLLRPDILSTLFNGSD